MKLIKKILLAIDFNERSNDAVRRAMHLASELEGEVVLMHVLPERGIFAPIVDELKRRTKERLEAVKERFEVEGVKKISVRVVSGEAHEEIAFYAEVMQASLVILGGGRPDGTERERLGTTAERVIRHCRKPVWVVRPGDRAEVRKILCPVDMSEHSARALRNAIRLADHFDASLAVLHAVPRLVTLVPQVGGLVDQFLEDDFFDKRSRTFKKFLCEIDFGDTKWTKSTKRGRPAEVIVERAKEHGADLIVMGSVGRTGLSRLLLGSVAFQVTRAFPCSVLTVKDVDVFHTDIQPVIDDIWNCYGRGNLLLKEGRAAQAIEQFQICISRNRLFVRAWEGLGDAYEQLGDTEATRRSREAAGRIYEQIWERTVENEVRAGKTGPRRPRRPRNAD